MFNEINHVKCLILHLALWNCSVHLVLYGLQSTSVYTYCLFHISESLQCSFHYYHFISEATQVRDSAVFLFTQQAAEQGLTRLLISTPMLSLYGPPTFKHKVGELILDLLRPREYQSLRLYLFRFRLTGKAWAIAPNRPGFKTRLQHFQVVQIWTSCPTSLYRSPPSWCGTIFPLVTICILKEDSTVFKALSSLVTY